MELTLSLENVKLPKYSIVKIIHVDDEGNTSTMEAEVNENGQIVFETRGFSTFAGFTVDFEYGAAFYSMPGMTAMYLSELFDKLRMPLYASDVTDVQFTDTSLVSVEQTEGDWLLTSLKAFDTQELLTFTMKDGTTYEINVTDAQSGSNLPDISVGGSTGNHDNDDNNVVRWPADGDGDLSNMDNISNVGWSQDKVIKIAGAGTGKFQIYIQPNPGSIGTTTETLHINIKQLQVLDGARVLMYLDGDSTDSRSFYHYKQIKQVIIHANDDVNLFYVDDGELELRGLDHCQMIIDGALKDGTQKLGVANDRQLVRILEQADKFTAKYVTFRNAPYGAIVCSSAVMTTFRMENRKFTKTVHRPTFGGAIYVKQNASDPNANGQAKYTKLDSFILKNVDFTGYYAGEKGGAIYLRGKIFDVSIDSDCTFNGCYAKKNDGGAIMLDAALGNVQIATEFINCYAKENGGAIALRSAKFTEVPRLTSEATPRIVHMFSRTNTLDLSGSRFTGCYTTITDSDTEGRGGAVDISAEVARVFMDGCRFDSCYSLNNKTSASGGAVCFSYANVPDNFKDTSKGGDSYWTADMTLDGATEESGGARRSYTYDWSSTDTDANGNEVTTVKTRTTIGPVSITNTTFTNCTAGFQGGAVLFRTGSCADSLTMTDVTIDNCSGAVQGGALMFVNTLIPVANLTRVTISNCKTLTPGEAGGILRTVGQTTMVLTLDDCEFRYNQSADSGGGLYWNAGHVRTPAAGGDPVNPKAIVKNCRFICNSSYLLDQETEGKGGGIFCEADMEVTDCLFVGNNAGQGGAICMAVYGNDYRMMQDGEVTRLKLNSGTEIYGNHARYGGGIMLRANATPSLKNDETLAHGVEFQLGGASVHDNAAKVNGGGVYVGAGGNLTVDEGYITYNTAIIPTGKTGPATGKGQTTGLYGTGGGVCVVGDGGSNIAKFTLTGETDMAIYGNIAAHSADDVFSNGSSTQLDIPLVADMNLAGYGFSPEGWFEDYNTNDTQYSAGLNMGRNDLVKSVERYRLAVSSKRKHITPAYVVGTYGSENVTSQVYVNKANAYVAMTLGIPAAVDDTVVVDFGLTVEFDLKENDLIVSDQDFVSSGKLGMQEPVAGSNGIKEKDDVVYGALLTNVFKSKELVKKTAELKHGKATMNGSSVKYQFLSEADKLNMTSDETFYYVVGHGDNGDGTYKNYYYAKVTIVPATSIYYEDNSGFVEFHEANENLNLVGWTPAVEDNAFSGANQDQDRPGAAELKDLDADNVYGYDSNYSEIAAYSMGNAMMTQVYGDLAARATFTFVGTGFDIISLCNKDTGTVMVSIYQGSDVIFEDDPNTAAEETPTKPYQTLLVDSWCETGDTLYQVPLIKKSGLPYGTWTVEVYVGYGWWADHGQNGGAGMFDFYLDAVRIYDPADIGGGAGSFVQDAYLKDNECWPSYQELRNLILTQDVLTDEAQTGILFVDGVGGMNKAPTITEYRNYGPNNEVYLADDQAVSFTLNAEAYNQGFATAGVDGTKVAAVHVAMRGLTGVGSVKISAEGCTPLELTLGTTDLYYDISGMMNKVVTIENTGSSPVSVSNVKVTHTADPGPAPSAFKLFTSSRSTAQTALAMLGARVQPDPVLTPKYPSLSFEDEICYNVYFEALELGDVTAADLGLAVFTAEATDGTVDTASAVTWGAVEKNGLYMVRTGGIAAKDLGDTLYFKVVARCADGSFVYSDLRSYSAVDYARDVLASSQDEALKSLVVAMLNYGTAAQTFFNYRTDAPVNGCLTAQDQALVEGYRADMMGTVANPSAQKAAAFAANGGFTARYPSVTFEGAFSINYYCVPQYAPQGDVTMYLWNRQDYEAAEYLTVDNATDVIAMTPGAHRYQTAVSGIAAKDLDEDLYVAFVYSDGTTTWSSGVLGYSVGAYCADQAASGMEQAPFAQATAVYGYYAKQLFGIRGTAAWHSSRKRR